MKEYNFTYYIGNFVIDIDYSILEDKNEMKIIRILSTKLFLHLINKHASLNSFLTIKGKNILNKFQYNISPIIQKSKFDQKISCDNTSRYKTLMPFKCVPIGKQKNSNVL